MRLTMRQRRISARSTETRGDALSVQTDSIAVRAIGSHRTADAAALDRLEQEIVDLDAQILAAVRRRTDLARTLAPAPVTAPPADTGSRFDELGSDGPALVRTLTRLGSAGQR